MDAELVDALRRPLELAAADGFAGVRRVQGLGHALRNACDRIVGGGGGAEFVAWRRVLGGWETLDEYQQAVEVARGMRLIARFPRADTAARPAPRPTFAIPGRPTDAPALPNRSPNPAVPRSASPASRSPAPTERPAPAVARPNAAAPASSPSVARANGAVSSVARTPASADARTNDSASSVARTTEASATRTNGAAASVARTLESADARANSAAPSGARTNVASPGARTPESSGARAHGAASSVARTPESSVGRTNDSAPTVARTAEASGARTDGVASTVARTAQSSVARTNDSTSSVAPSAEASGARTAGAASGARTSAAGAPAAKASGDPAGAEAAAKKPRAKKPPVDADVDPLAQPTHSLPGIGPAFAERLAERGLVTVEDLIWLVPRRYDDVRDAMQLAGLARVEDGQRATFVARVMSSRMVFARGRRWGEVRLAELDGPPTSATVRWFNVWAGIDKRVPVGCRVVLSGPLKRRDGRLEFANPDILGVEEIDAAATATASTAAPSKPMPAILSRYPDIHGVPAGRLRSACAAACARVADHVEDGVPAVIEQAAKLPSLAETVSRLHAPPPTTTPTELAAMNRGDSRWQRRLAFGELFALGVAVALRRRERCAGIAVACPRAPDLAALLARALPFSPTKAQARAIAEIGDDLARPTPMNRLLQGDVGAGKTAVAFAAALQVARAGRQTAIMAPTELLAEQHAATWRAWAERLDAESKLRVELLTASTPKPTRASLLALLAAGQIDVLVGTHSLLSEGVGFGALGLCIVDEQHRFGVAQRARLRDKSDGQGTPHLLVMTATPIPRTLALTAYGDLDTSILDELPPGRTPIVTKVAIGARGRTAAYKLIGERVAAGERAYVVCPKVEPTDDDALFDDGPKRTYKDATTTADELAAALPHARVGLVHGRLDTQTRDRVMRAFRDGEIDVLCATTVIEVGVDVPAATVIAIHDAERFGLAQLHQLRGRVGRGTHRSHCILLSQGNLGEDGELRLSTLERTTDGFVIAETDLAMRGAGELLGARQAGVPRLRFGDLASHTQLLLEARGHAEAVLAADPDLVRPEHAALRRALERRLATAVYGPETG